VLAAAAALFLAFVLVDGAVRTGFLAKVPPRALTFFVQFSCLFPSAAVERIEYRAEGYDCQRRRYYEIDVAPLFPIHKNDKESRFDRAVHFYRHNRRVLEALDEYIVTHWPGPGRLGGVELLSLREPLPAPDESFPRYERRPILQFPNDQRHYWYITPAKLREARCANSR